MGLQRKANTVRKICNRRGFETWKWNGVFPMNRLLEIRSVKWKERKTKILRKQDNDNANGVEVRIPHNYWSNQTNLLPSFPWCSCMHCSSLFVIRLPSVGKVPYAKAYESETFSFLEYDMLEFVTTWINLSYALGFVSLLDENVINEYQKTP